MPRNACPHCPEGFINRDLLEVHIRFVHPDGPAQSPAPLVVTQRPSRSTGYLAMISAQPAPTAPPSAPVEDDSVGSTPTRAAHPPGVGRFRLSEVPDGPAPEPPQSTPLIESMMGTLGPQPMTEQGQEANRVALVTPETRQELPEPVLDSRSTPSAALVRRISWHGPVRFTVVYVAEAQNFSRTLHLPNITPWPSFLHQLAVVSTPVAQRYIFGRSDGFRLGDGAWRFSLVDNRGVVEGRWRPLTRILFYQAMISELLKPDSPWKHAQVWHEAQSGETVRFQPPLAPSQPALTMSQTQLRLQTATNSNTPVNIIDGRTSFGRRSFLVQWLDGRPDCWVNEEDLEGHQTLIDGYLRNLEGDRP